MTSCQNWKTYETSTADAATDDLQCHLLCFRIFSKAVKLGTLAKCAYGGGVSNPLCDAGVVTSAACILVEIIWELLPEDGDPPEQPDPDPDPDPDPPGRQLSPSSPDVRLAEDVPFGEWR